MMEPPTGLRLIDKTFDVLDHLAQSGELTIAQLSEKMGEPRSSLYRLLERLERLELVEPTASRGYFRLGTHLLKWGAAAQSNLSVRNRALSVMEDIRLQTGLTVYLVVRRGWHGVCVERLEGLRVTSLALTLGGSLPLHAGAAPRALLAFESEEMWREYTANVELTRFTPQTPATPDELYKVLARERNNGNTLSDGDVTEGIASVGAPIRDYKNGIHAALSVSGLREAVLGANAEHVRSLVVEGAATISRAMGYAPPADIS